MHHIKCSKCGQLIPVKSEFMVLCPHCNKKLDNSFREWSVKKPNATFAQYLSQVCVSNAAISGLNDQRRITRKIGIFRNFKHLAIAILIAVVTVIVSVWGFYLYSESQKGASINAIIEDSWKINYYEDLGVTLKFPFVLASQHVTVDSIVVADSTQTILSHASRSWSRPAVTVVSAVRVEFAPALGVNREMATQQILQSIVQDNGMQAFEFVPSDYSMGQGVKARMFSGSYLIGVEPYQFRAIMVVKGDLVWYFMVAYPRSMPEGTLLAEKFFKGILL